MFIQPLQSIINVKLSKIIKILDFLNKLLINDINKEKDLTAACRQVLME